MIVSVEITEPQAEALAHFCRRLRLDTLVIQSRSPAEMHEMHDAFQALREALKERGVGR